MKKFFKKILTKRLRWILRGYRTLKKEHSQGKIYELMHAIVRTRFQKDNVYSRIIFGAAEKDAELVVRQYLIARTIVGINFSKSLLYTCGKEGAWVTHPLPPEWRKIVRQHGFKIPKLWATFVWNSYVVLLFTQGLLSIWKRFFESVKTIRSPSENVLKPFVFFCGLTAGNTPQRSNGVRSYDIISWYGQWSGRIKEINALCHDVKNLPSSVIEEIPVTYMPLAIPPFTRFTQLIRYMGWSIAATGLSIIDLFRGRWWHALLLKEASLAALARMQRSQNLARDYLFHNSNWAYRPLWTYEAIEQGSKITFYFYSTTCGDGFKRSQGYPPPYFGYSAMNWPYYLVWNDHQAASLSKIVGKSANISVVGPIWFQSSVTSMPKLPLNSVAVFDVQPVRDGFYKSFGIDFDYYTPHTAIQFLSDVYDALVSSNCRFILKRKRNIDRLAHPKYRQFIKELDKLPGFTSIEPDIAAIELIKNSIAVISMPFTSTAVIGRELGKPSVYYDPHGLIQKDDRGAHGIDILCGLQELHAWVSTITNSERMNEEIF
ncbi:MAG: polysaccharide biosynthesis PFTS motif protein [Legionella sp.]|nr:MAG: polysaccharide biosynthesis PFTS motif protein [Legionella sp.]